MTMVIQTGSPPVEATVQSVGGCGAEELTRINAVAKLESAIASTRGRLPWDVAMVAADTLVHQGSAIYGKPEDTGRAREMLHQLRGTKHNVTTSVAMTYAPHRQRRDTVTRTVTSEIQMRYFTDAEMERYLASGIWVERAGAYGVQDAEFNPAAGVQGCYLNVVGLPLCAVLDMLPEDDYPFERSHVFATCAAHLEQGAP